MIDLLFRLFVSSITFTVSLALTLLFYYGNNWPAYNETQARDSLAQIVRAQYLYCVTEGKGSFADLKTLGREELIDSVLASGKKDGYLYTCEPIQVQGKASMFDVKAKPKHTGIFWSGYRSYYSNEIIIVWERNGREPPEATKENRKPKEGFMVR